MDPSKLDLELALTVKLQQLFPNLLEDIMMKLVPRLEAVKMQNFGSILPWNRRKRRRLSRAKNVVLHVFSGKDPQLSERQLSTPITEVLCVDLQDGCKANLLDMHVYGYLLTLLQIVWECFLEGHRVEQFRHYEVKMMEDQVYSEVKLGRIRMDFQLCPLQTRRRSTMTASSSSATCQCTLWLRKWDHLKIQWRSSSWSNHVIPAKKRSDSDHRQYMSMFRTEEWQRFQDMFEFHQVDFDHGRMGHERCKPTTLLTPMTALTELHGLHWPPVTANVTTWRFERPAFGTKDWKVQEVGGMGPRPHGNFDTMAFDCEPHWRTTSSGAVAFTWMASWSNSTVWCNSFCIAHILASAVCTLKGSVWGGDNTWSWYEPLPSQHWLSSAIQSQWPQVVSRMISFLKPISLLLKSKFLYLPARACADDAPARRQRRKAAQPAISMFHIEGEERIVARCTEMFEPVDTYHAGDSRTAGQLHPLCQPMAALQGS